MLHFLAYRVNVGSTSPGSSARTSVSILSPAMLIYFTHQRALSRNPRVEFKGFPTPYSRSSCLILSSVGSRLVEHFMLESPGSQLRKGSLHELYTRKKIIAVLPSEKLVFLQRRCKSALTGALHMLIGTKANGQTSAGPTSQQCMLVDRNLPGSFVGQRRRTKFARLEHCMIWGSICHAFKSALGFHDKKASRG